MFQLNANFNLYEADWSSFDSHLYGVIIWLVEIGNCFLFLRGM